MAPQATWQTVYDFWFPSGLDDADPETHRRMFLWWFGGGSSPELPPFSPIVKAARAGHLDHWLATPPCCMDPAGIQQNQAFVEIDRF